MSSVRAYRQSWTFATLAICAVATSGALAQQSKEGIGTSQYYLDRMAIASPEIKARLAELAKEGKARGWTFQTGYTTAADIPLEQLTGLRIPANFLEGAAAQNRFAAEAIRLDDQAAAAAGREEPAPICKPSSPAFDWKDAGEITPVKDQNPCGTCWIFAALGAYEASYHVRNKETIDASEQQVMDCVIDEEHHTKIGSCMGGGWPDYVFKWNILNGIAREVEVPYTAKEGVCKRNVAAPYTSITWGFVSVKDPIPPVGEIKQAICEHGAVAVAVRVGTGAFEHYTGGVFNENDPEEVDHAVLLTGWDDARQAWHMKNSWGLGWGESGWMWIKYGSNSIGFAAAWVRSNSKSYNLSPELSALYKRHFGAPGGKSGDVAAPASGVPTGAETGARETKLAARTEGNELDGAWLMNEGEGILRIAGSEWRHPDKGLASLSRGRQAGEYEVTYQQYQGIKCEYRITKAADGRILTLEAADATQLLDYCPSGKLLKAD